MNLLGFTDADEASQDHCCAISGHTFLINGDAVGLGRPCKGVLDSESGAPAAVQHCQLA